MNVSIPGEQKAAVVALPEGSDVLPEAITVLAISYRKCSIKG